MTNEAGERTWIAVNHGYGWQVDNEYEQLAYHTQDATGARILADYLNTKEQEIAELRAKGELADQLGNPEEPTSDADLLYWVGVTVSDGTYQGLMAAVGAWHARYDSLTKSEEAKG